MDNNENIPPEPVHVLITFDPPQYSHFHDMKGYQCRMYDMGDYYVMAKDCEENHPILRSLPKDWATIVTNPLTGISPDDVPF